MADQRVQKRPGRFSVLLPFAVIIALVTAWILIQSLPYKLQWRVFQCLAMAYVVFPFVLLIIPRRFMWSAWLFALWGLLLSLGFHSRMNRAGDWLLAMAFFLTSFWAAASGAFIACSPPRGIVFREPTKPEG